MLMSVFEGLSDAAKTAIEAAHTQARRLGAPATGPEHLLLGVLTTSPGVATVFADLGVTAAHLERPVAAGAEAVPLTQRPDRFTPAGRRTLEMSLRERLALGDPDIGAYEWGSGLLHSERGCAARLRPRSPGPHRRRRHEQADHAVVQVGFPGQDAYYYLNVFRHEDGWRLQIPEGRDV